MYFKPQKTVVVFENFYHKLVLRANRIKVKYYIFAVEMKKKVPTHSILMCTLSAYSAYLLEHFIQF